MQGALRITPGRVSQGRPVLSGLESGIFILGAHVPGVQVCHLSAKPLLQGICSTDHYEIGLWLQIRITAPSKLNISTLTLSIPLQPVPNISIQRPDENIPGLGG